MLYWLYKACGITFDHKKELYSSECLLGFIVFLLRKSCLLQNLTNLITVPTVVSFFTTRHIRLPVISLNPTPQIPSTS